ncbi:hypothetical protein ACN28S_63200 [Cystobacter fuscus]
MLLLMAALVGCGSTNESVHPDANSGVDDVEADASAEELYFELVRIHSAGLLPPGRMEALLLALDEVDSRHEEGSQEHHEQQRVVLVSFLRRALRELRQGEDAAVVEAWHEGRAYARKLNHAGVREAERYAENTLQIAGMMGVPTSKEDLVLMVGIPVGGYVVVKAGGMLIQRATFLMRKLRSVDDVVEHAKVLKLHMRYAANETELRQVAGEVATDAVLRTEAHVGTHQEKRLLGKENAWNPSDRDDNCTACVATVIRNSLEGYFKYSVDEMERLFGYAGRERQFDEKASLRYIEKATGLKATSKPVAMLGGAPVGHYAVFTRWSNGGYKHVVYGRVTPTGRVTIFDPQTLEHMTYPQMLKRYGKAMPYRLGAAR